MMPCSHHGQEGQASHAPALSTATPTAAAEGLLLCMLCCQAVDSNLYTRAALSVLKQHGIRLMLRML